MLFSRDIRLLAVALASMREIALAARVSSDDSDSTLAHAALNASMAHGSGGALHFPTDTHVQLTRNTCRQRVRDMRRDSLVGLALALQLDREAHGPEALNVWDPWSGLLCEAMEQG